MAPKAASAASKKAGAAPAHASYRDMIKVAIVTLKDRMGSSRQAIKKYVRNNNDLGATSDAAFDKHIAAALNHGEKAGEFNRPKGPSGPVKLAKKDAVKKETTPKPVTTKTKSEKAPAAKPKAAATNKAAPKKSSTAAAASTKKAAPKKTTTTKANTSKKAAPKKTATKKAPAAPAVVDVKPTALTKTKSGRVQKTTKPVAKAAPKKTTTKKAAPKKAAAKA